MYRFVVCLGKFSVYIKGVEPFDPDEDFAFASHLVLMQAERELNENI